MLDKLKFNDIKVSKLIFYKKEQKPCKCTYFMVRLEGIKLVENTTSMEFKITTRGVSTAWMKKD